MKFLLDLISATPWWELLLIFSARVIEVSMGTLRIILINKGYRKQGVLLAFFEVLIWVFVASKVIVGINEQPFKGIVYSFGFASGVYVGSKIENRLAFGKVVIQVITSTELGSIIAKKLRDDGIGVTKMVGEGKDTVKDVLLIYAKRKCSLEINEKIIAIDDKAVITTTDLSSMTGGYLSSWKTLFK